MKQILQTILLLLLFPLLWWLYSSVFKSYLEEINHGINELN